MAVFKNRKVLLYHIFPRLYCLSLIVQLGPGLKSETKALDQSRTLNLLWTTHPPPTTANFLRGSRLRMRPRFGMQASYRSKSYIPKFWPPPQSFDPPPLTQNFVELKIFFNLKSLVRKKILIRKKMFFQKKFWSEKKFWSKKILV